MGRPIKEKFFGNTNSPFTNYPNGGTTGKGGEGFSALVVTNTATNSGYSTSTTVIWTASTPQVAGGVAATGTAVVGWFGAGRIQSLTVTTTGTGYTSTSGVTLSYVPTSAGTAATFVLNLTSTKQNAITGLAYITGGSANSYDIKKQEASRRYLVQTTDGTGQCKLVTTSTLAAGEMNIVATDLNGSTYYVKKLTARRAVLVQTTASGSFLFDNNEAAGWTINGASSGIVSLSNV